MTIKFVCSCGKHLRARDEMAARRSACPRCGAPVGIPSLRPTHSGTAAAPLSPLERLRHAKTRQSLPGDAPPSLPESPSPILPRKLDKRLVHLLPKGGTRRPELTGRHLELRWYECLFYPLRAFKLFLGLAIIMSLVCAASAVFLPHLLMDSAATTSGSSIARLVMLSFLGVVLLIFVIGLPCSFLECVLASAVAGEVYYIRWSGNLVNEVLGSGVKWLACFLAGPALFAGLACIYWLQCGDAGIFDWLIVLELGLVAVSYWIVAIVAVTDRGNLRGLNPVAVADMAHRLGWRSIAVILAAASLLLLHFRALTFGVAEVHNGTAKGWLMMIFAWVSGLFWSTFLCRLLGLWCFRTQDRYS